jgi:hypothetical protein
MVTNIGAAKTKAVLPEKRSKGQGMGLDRLLASPVREDADVCSIED